MHKSSPLPSAPSVAALPRPKQWLRWGLWLVVAVLVVASVALALLDPWLRRTLEKQVATASKGRYQLVVDELRTHVMTRTVVLRGVHLRTVDSTAASQATRLPTLSFDLAQLRVAGIGIGAVLRKQVVPLDSLLLEGLQLQVGELSSSSQKQDQQPKLLYQQLPLGLPGVRVGHLALRQLKARYGTTRHTHAQIGQAHFVAQDLYLSAAGAADTTRVAYAASLKAEVHGLLARMPDHLVRLRHGAFSSAGQQLVVDSVRIVPLQPISNQRTRTARLDVTLPQLTLTGLQAAGLARGRFQAADLRLAGLRLLATVSTEPPPALHQAIADYLPYFQLGQLHLTGAQVQIAGLEAAPAVQDINLTGSELRLQPDTPGQLFYARAWTLRTGRARFSLDAPYYQLTYQTLQADTRRAQLQLDNLAFAPTMSAATLAKRKGHQTPHVRLRIPRVSMAGLNWEALLEENKLLAQRVQVSKARVITESDGRFAINPNQSIATPEAIGRLPYRVDVRQLRLTDLGIRMSYRSPRNAQPGVMAIQQLTGTLFNISNDPSRMSAARPLTGQMTGRIQEVCDARLALRANLLDPSGKHTLTGTFGAAPLAMLNPMVLPTRGLRFRSGDIQQIRFQMQLDRTQVRGTMWASYRELKLDILNRQNKPGVLHRVKTSLANGIFLRDNNPRQPGQELQTGSVKSRRELRYSVFSLWRQGLVSGMLNSAGVPKGMAEKLSEAE